MKTRPALRILFLALLLLAAGPAQAQKSSLEALCRLHGIGEEESIGKIRAAYLEAVEAGITEQELFAFMEDILRHKLDCPQMVRVLAVTTKLKAADLPYFVVFSKVREGVAKMAPPALVVEVAEGKLKSLTDSRDVLLSLESSGYRVRDFQNAAVIVSSYIEKGYRPVEMIEQVRNKGIEGAGFTALSAVVEEPVKRKAR